MKGENVILKAADGHRLRAWLASPAGKPRAGLVVFQEIFGVNHHIQSVTERFADLGYLAIAPAMFDRIESGVELGYKDMQRGLDYANKLDNRVAILDTQAAIESVRSAGKVGAIGYCWGGSMADLAACHTDVAAAVSYYGRRQVNWLDVKPRCPVQYHFGRKDLLIPPEIVEQIRAGRAGHEVFVYDEANHGFNCDERPEFHPESAALALQRTLGFFDRYLA